MLTTEIKPKKKLWTCPKCGRKFARQRQVHSCRTFSLSNHFTGKPQGKLLYQKLKSKLRERIGFFRVESLECCIHFASICTFAAIIIYKGKIRIDFAANRQIKSSQIVKSGRLSTNRFVYRVDIFSEDEIDNELLEWIEESTYEKE